MYTLKKNYLCLLIALTGFGLIPTSAFAQINEGVASNYYYIPNRNEYRVNYSFTASQNGEITQVQLVYTNLNNGEVHEATFPNPTGIMMLTCQGTYDMIFMDANGNVRGSIRELVTPLIVNGTCQSYSDGGAKDELNANVGANGSVSWSPIPGAVSYDIYKDGQHYQTTNDTSAALPDGSYTIVARDGNGGVIGESDFNLPGISGGGSTGCDGCGWIKSALSCPEWDDYMGEWASMIDSVVPDAPDWHEVAGIMRDTIVPAMGDELIRRSPEMADIFADEFQSREKPVSPPPTAPPVFDPDVPELIDLPDKIEVDLTEGVPQFEPDYSGSAPFSLPDPMAVDMNPDDKDGGYALPDQPELPDKPYTPSEPETPQPELDYVITPQPEGETPPDYNLPGGGVPPQYTPPAAEEPPVYSPPDPVGGGGSMHEFYEMQEGGG